ncbi:DUF1579 family protein [Mucilaginibacter sp. McL0603]|uniref:DUF1579 family protein n=1 Tax=Mucilaginibacter sp. McL0603 TaxID=3415670 RepID=UPI003CF5F2EE
MITNIKMTGSVVFIYKGHSTDFPKWFKSMLIVVIALITIPAFAQDKKDTSANGDEVFYSRPGKYHQMLGELVGSWTFKGSRFDWVDSVTSKVAMELNGSLVRKPFADGRFFIAEIITRDKIQLPIQDGKMVEGYGESIQTEGYDNVKKKFQISYINNHIGSTLNFWEGVYDSTSRAITFDSEMENAPGIKMKIRFIFMFNDKDHYKWEYYIEQNGRYRIADEMHFTRVKGE